MPTPEKIYDKIFIGGGLASIFTTYATLALAKEAGKPFQVLLVADEIKAPVTAGSHCVAFVEGLAENGVKNRDAIQNLLRQDGREGLKSTINQEQIDCRYVSGYEIKARTSFELASVLENIAHGNRSFAKQDTIENSDSQTLKLEGYPYSISVKDVLAQVNTPELLHGLVAAIKKMGGEVITSAHYKAHDYTDDGLCRVSTSEGTFNTRANPFLGTGALHQSALPDFYFKHDITYTAGLVVGPLSDEDAQKISAGPMAFCDVNFNDDVLWGGIDPHNMLTIGKGDLHSPDDLPALKQDLIDIANHMLPGITDKYQAVFNSGPMLTPENTMPVIGRMKSYDIAGGWAGLGIVAGFAAARAFADWYVHGDDAKLKVMESMQPKGFPGAPGYTPGGAIIKPLIWNEK